MAAVVGEPRTYSPRLRAGIADTAAFLGGYVADQRLNDGATGEQHAQRVVRAVTEHANADPTGRAWQSLADVLPLLAEAAPDAFLDAVDVGLGGDPPLLRSLFLDAELGPTFGTSSPHIRLVWALEALAWSSAHMSRAAGALARLAEIDPQPDANIHPAARGQPGQRVQPVRPADVPPARAPPRRPRRAAPSLTRGSVAVAACDPAHAADHPLPVVPPAVEVVGSRPSPRR